MYSSAELIDALLARGRKRLWFREPDEELPPGEFPSGWKAWFAAMRERVGAVTGATAEAIVAIFLQRELATPAPRSAELNRWQAFSTLWRQQWHASESDTPRERIIAIVITVLVHLVLAILLLWLAYVRFTGEPAPPGEDVIQVEFIGEGTPEETGGGAPAAVTDVATPTPTPAAAPANAQAAAQTAPPAAQPPPTPAAPAPRPQPPAEAAAQQPLVVTETETPDSTFVVPPTTPRELQVEAPRMRTLTVQTIDREVELVETPEAPAVRPQVVEIAPVPPQAKPVETQVQPRDIPLLSRPRPLPQVAQTPDAAPQRSAPAVQIRTRDVPLASGASQTPATQPAPGAASSETRVQEGTSSTASTASPSGPPAATPGSGKPAATAGRGPSPVAAPGGWPTPRRGDDWGDSDRNRPGGNAGQGQSGLFNADGSPKLPPGTAAAGGGFPPGSDNWTRDQLERHGTWAKRPPIGYDPTRFDEYWIPSGTLLQEWVRRGIKSMAIPIPGTSKKINCTISILQLGGGCGISDPDMQDQEAIARPPPDIPYKPELQEGGP